MPYINEYYCAKCKTKVKEEEIRCPKCKSLLAPDGAIKIKKAYIKENKIKKKNLKKSFKRRKPWLAALLNIFYGVGYLYNGKRKVFAWFLFIGMCLIIGGTIYSGYKGVPSPKLNIYDWMGSIFITFAFMYDAYKEAKSINEKRKAH